MRKNRRKNRNQEESREALEQRLADYINDNFRLQDDKLRLLDDKQTLKSENLKLTVNNEYLTKENQNIKQMMKVNSLILILMFQLLNICNELDDGWGIKRLISDYLVGISNELHKMPGALNPADYDPYNPSVDDDDVINLDDYED